MRARRRKIGALLLAGGSSFLFFLPVVSITVYNYRYSLSGFELLVGNGLLLADGTILSPAWILRGISLSVPVGMWIGAVGFFLGAIRVSEAAFGSSFLSVFLFAGLLLQWDAPPQASITVSYHWLLLLFLFLPMGGILLCFRRMGKEQAMANRCFLCTGLTIGAAAWMGLDLAAEGIPAIAEIGLAEWFSGTVWNPQAGQFGILPMLLTTLYGTVGAILLAAPLGILTAMFLRLQTGWLAALLRQLLELLSGLPSIVYGLFGMLFLLPALRACFDESIGDSLLAAILVLSMLILPSITAAAEEALAAVPVALEEGALALGAGRATAMVSISLLAARRGIVSGILQGIRRAAGETMAILFVAGNTVCLPQLFSPVRFLTTGIALELSYAAGLHRQALYAMGLVLFGFFALMQLAVHRFLQGGERT